MTPPALKIGEFAKATGLSVTTLRYYESLGLITPADRAENNYRYYRTDQIQRVEFIKKAQQLRFSLDEIRQILGIRQTGLTICPMVQTLLDDKIQHLDQEIQQLQQFKQDLEVYRDRWQQTDPHPTPTQICPLIEDSVMAIKQTKK
jgi:DNA-binding transcriptional MerR regulator